MSEPKKLSESEIAAIQERIDKALRSAGRFWQRVRPLSARHWTLGTISNHVAKPIDSEEAWDLIEAVPTDMPALLDHIAAMEAEQQRVAIRTASDAFEVGHANANFIERQTQRIQDLEKGIRGVLEAWADETITYTISGDFQKAIDALQALIEPATKA